MSVDLVAVERDFGSGEEEEAARQIERGSEHVCSLEELMHLARWKRSFSFPSKIQLSDFAAPLPL